MNVIRIASHNIQPLQPREEPGMPTYRVVGTIDDAPFCVDVSCEIDGRDCEFENRAGKELGYDEHAVIFEALCGLASFVEQHNKEGEKYYAAH